MTTYEVALRMMDAGSAERKEAEKMMGISFDAMTQSQRVLAAQMIAALGLSKDE